jgi:hypothetical protein
MILVTLVYTFVQIVGAQEQSNMEKQLPKELSPGTDKSASIVSGHFLVPSSEIQKKDRDGCLSSLQFINLSSKKVSARYAEED